MKLDMHIHTRYSRDSWMDPARLIEVAARCGLDGIAVVDHGTLDGALRTSEIAGDRLLVIPGMEISTEIGHVAGLFLKEPVKSCDAASAVSEIHAQDGIAVLAHPLKTIADVPEEILASFDAIEAHNSRNCTMNDFARRHGADKLGNLSRTHGLALIAGSDAHFYREVGRGITVVDAADIEGVRAAIMDQKTSVSGIRSSYYYKFLSGTIRMSRS